MSWSTGLRAAGIGCLLVVGMVSSGNALAEEPDPKPQPEPSQSSDEVVIQVKVPRPEVLVLETPKETDYEELDTDKPLLEQIQKDGRGL